MSEEKLYAVKNHSGEFWDFLDSLGFCALYSSDCPTTTSKDQAELVADEQGGYVVTLIEEPEKVVLTKEQAEIVENANDYPYPSRYIFDYADYSSGTSIDVELLIKAYVNGYTVEKEKKYNVKVPQTQTSYYYKGSDGHVHASDTSGGLDNQFSDYELQQYGLDGERFTKEEVTDDE
ncbi:DUF1642 domain-containing protein [Lacticaseibacillus paracasei]|uniref:DUF1642 domain-containing protein n=1 Tax=Lacticaseibacillus paracasei TaxID=1597 RepID=UPI0005904D4A|nr:DUF1642 domain-containing protein [Lacticaseibacillus paracasei]ALX88142.1 hypothetical protein AWC33_02605 [Lacticaseibacillus paracasei]